MGHQVYNLSVEEKSSYDGAVKYTKAYLVTPDAAATVEGAGYLNASVARLPKGTRIEAVMAVGGTPVAKNYVVTANNGTAVTIALQATAAG